MGRIFVGMVVVLVALLTTISCSDDSFAEPSSPSERRVAAVIESFYRALAVGDAGGACRRLTPEAQVRRAASAEGTRCEDGVDPGGEPVDEDPGVYDVVIDGDEAEAIVSVSFGGEGAGWRFSLVRSGGRWLISDAELLGTVSE